MTLKKWGQGPHYLGVIDPKGHGGHGWFPLASLPWQNAWKRWGLPEKSSTEVGFCYTAKVGLKENRKRVGTKKQRSQEIGAPNCNFDTSGWNQWMRQSPPKAKALLINGGETTALRAYEAS